MMKITRGKLNGCLLRYPVLCFKGIFDKKFTLCCYLFSIAIVGYVLKRKSLK
ncbi:Uncharacterized protein APZ42_030641 [Daphnia magna]|uniref:Uncharacterized protein n=1 Tax=Daphnia magna TaxID=35525 RepID=A0A164NPR3_9CRUS|nr:Uncharacterized protein APZ42_030641 [Daphnia magna]